MGLGAVNALLVDNRPFCVMKNKMAGYSLYKNIQPSVILILAISALALPYPKHLGPTYGAHTLSRRLPVLHNYGLSIFHFPFGTAFHTIRLHWVYLLFCL